MTPAAKSFSTSITVRLVVCLKIHPAANSIVTLATIMWRRPGGLILYCTVLYCTVLYKKWENYKKLENLQTENKQTSKQRTNREFKNWGHSNPLWIVGVSGPIYCTVLYCNVRCKYIGNHSRNDYFGFITANFLEFNTRGDRGGWGENW